MNAEVVIAEGQCSTQPPTKLPPAAARAQNFLQGLSARVNAEVVTALGQHSTHNPFFPAAAAKAKVTNSHWNTDRRGWSVAAADVLRKPTNCHPPAAAKFELEVMSGCSLEIKPLRLERFLHSSEWDSVWRCFCAVL